MKRLLIDEQKKQADAAVLNEQQNAKKLNEAVAFYNGQKNLEDLTKDTVFQFLKDPMNYLNEAIFKDTGIVLGKAKPDPEQVARMFGISYPDILRKAHIPCNLDNYTYSESGFELSKAAEKEIREKHKFYLEQPEHISEYNRLKKLCDVLNEHAEKFKLAAFVRNTIAQGLEIECKSNGSAREYKFEPDLMAMKKHL